VCKIACEALETSYGVGRFCARGRSSHAIIRRCRDIAAQTSKAGYSFSRLCLLTGRARCLSNISNACGRFIHFNPLKHGYVGRVCDWPYSSFHRYLRNDLLTADWGGDLAEIEGRFGE